ncbi:N-acetylglucosamine-6-phosphate deacetylase [Sporosarcina saromensis]|uniref:N-acetylglucosamine-6-phosphate deacetylase n=1 Tax=Sporosarcina saromensis TaxID=359365 RepID=A0ABU4GDV8_9BACL|nr:N-acetylglucosamine-6-phosphate deacetylase [Sporosarcina saromensis]MDW0115176.1 N-acetylglucosamine-6-phosphate deacetylase [Sporosarcina saromensis]
MNKLLFKNAELVLENEVLANSFLFIEGDKIQSFGPMEVCPSANESYVTYDCTGKTIMPGMIDIHVHGAGGADFMDAVPEAVSTIADTLVKEGTTSYLATTMTQSVTQIEKALSNIASYMEVGNKPGTAEMLGIHLEGPYINEKQKGAQLASDILPPNHTQFNNWQRLSGEAIRIVTLAPELDDQHLLIRTLHETGVIGSMGHTDATYDEVKVAIESGISHATHLFNGMRGLHHREPGVLGAALLRESVHVEVIPDGIHFHPDLVKLVCKMKGIDKILVITDGMRAKGMHNGEYDLGGNEVIVANGKCTLKHGSSLAGSIVTMNTARKNMASWLELSMLEQAKITSLNQAKRLGIDHRKGSISRGKDADIVILDGDGDVTMTICRGNVAYNCEELSTNLI